MADWAIQVIEKELNLNNKRVHILGYSLGCFIAACVARHYPHRVEKLVLMAPVGVVSPVRKAWLAQAILFAIVSKIVPQDGVLADRLRMWFFGSMMADADAGMKNLKYPELRKAADAVGGPQVQVQPGVWDVEPTLTDMVAANPMLLLIGQQENVVDPIMAVEAATRSGMKVKVYENAGHMFFCELPREIVIDEVKDFLSSSSSDDK
jgi:pimeloyl-ACP methyl ester carboxylesterase